MKRRCGFILLAFALLLSAPGARACAGTVKKYNIIAIVTDDQGCWALGAYGNREVKTPHMDRIAREGARFANAFTATPVCSPSRASFMTGRYGTQVKITDYISPAEGQGGVGLPQDAMTWPEVLQRAGYVTALIGKWHLGNLPQFHPARRGFNHFVGFVGGGTTPMNPTLEVNGKPQKLQGAEPDVLTDHALEFIKANKGRAFALSLHFRAPHLPYGPVPEQDSAPFKNLDPTIPNFPGLDAKQVKNWTRDYYASIHSVDRNLGRLLKFLDEAGLADSTIIVFTSDHGYMIGHHGCHTKGNATWIVGGTNGPRRPNMFDDSLRIPLLIRWPGVVKPKTEVKELVSNIDTFASVLGMLKVPAPEKYKQEGKDFSPLLRGEKVAWRDAVFAQYDLHNFGLAYMRSIHTGRYHLVRYHFAKNKDELFDSESDPSELKNLYTSPKLQDIRERLEQRLTAWEKSIDDPVLRGAR
jgi:arylsulfatase A-like enzyme